MQSKFSSDNHLDMLIDTLRVAFYDKELVVAKDKTVLELGSGSGILAYLAFKHGAKSVVGIEQDKAIAAVAKQVIANLLPDANYKIIVGDYNEIDWIADIIIHETYGSDATSEVITEGTIPKGYEYVNCTMTPSNIIATDYLEFIKEFCKVANIPYRTKAIGFKRSEGFGDYALTLVGEVSNYTNMGVASHW